MIARTLFSIIAVVAFAGVAAADPKAEAQVHIDHAKQLHGDGKLAEALQELKDAYVLDPRPELLFAIGQIHVNLGQCTEAITYYQRFLGTNPDRDAAAVTREAIETCKKNPPVIGPKIEPKVEPQVEPKVEPKIVPKLQVEARPWYTDAFGDAFVGVGLVVGVTGGVFYSKARSDRSKADDVSSFQAYAELIDDARRQRTIALVLGLLGGAVVTGGVVHMVVYDRPPRVTFAPTPGGGAVTWTRGF